MQYNIGDKVVRLQSRPNDMWVLGSTPVTIADIRDSSVTFLEQETLVGLDYWGLDCYKLYQPKSTLTNKEQAMNSMVVSDLTPKKQRKLAAVLDSLGYTFDGDLGLAANILIRFTSKHYSTNFGSYNTRLNGRVYICAEGKKYKAILAEVLAALPVETPEPVEEPKLELKVGSKVRVVSSPIPDLFAVGTVGIRGKDSKVTFSDDYWCIDSSSLEVVPDDTPVTTCIGGNPDLTVAFEVGCTVERTKHGFQGMTVGDIDVVKEVHSHGVRLHKYQRGTGYHDTANLKVIKGA